MRHERLFRTAVMITALALIGVACGDSDGATTTAAPSTTEAPATTAAPSTTEAPATTEGSDGGEAVIEVTAVDYGYQGLPATVAAGTRITLANRSSTELHEFVAIRLPDDETRSVEELLMLPPEELEAFFPFLKAVLLTPPEAREGFAAFGTGVLDEPGRYLVICAIPTGADPQEYLDAAAESEGPPDVAGGPPHFANGMFAELIVEG